MKLTLKNIGKVRQAEIELKGITVIGGENNTGKSTIAKALFAMCHLFYNLNTRIYRDRVIGILVEIRDLFLNSHYRFSEDVGLPDIAQKLLEVDASNRQDAIREQLVLWIKNLAEFPGKGPVVLGEDNRPAKLDDEFLGKVNEQFLERIEEYITMPSEKILEKFLDGTIRWEFSKRARCVLNHDAGKITLFNEGRVVDILIEEGQNGWELTRLKSPLFEMKNTIYIDNAVGFNEGHLLHQEALMSNFHKIPAQDSAIKEIITDRKLEAIFREVSRVSEGDLVLEKYDTWSYALRGTDKMIPMENLSAGLQIFAMVKHLLKNGSLQESGILILDEPETHLHPAWQLALARIIVLLHREFELKILLNTHSHYFLNAIDVYSREYGLEGECRYYLSSEKDGMAEVEDVTKSLNRIYEILWEPLQDLEDAEAGIEERAEQARDE